MHFACSLYVIYTLILFNLDFMKMSQIMIIIKTIIFSSRIFLDLVVKQWDRFLLLTRRFKIPRKRTYCLNRESPLRYGLALFLDFLRPLQNNERNSSFYKRYAKVCSGSWLVLVFPRSNFLTEIVWKGSADYSESFIKYFWRWAM